MDYGSLIKWLKENYQDKNQKKLLSVWKELNSRKIEEAKRQCDDFIKSIMFESNSYYRSCIYIFDSIITDYLLQKSDKSVKWMLNFVKDMFLLDMDPYDILSMMLPSSMMFLFEYTYNVSYGDKFYLKKKDCSIKKLTLFNKE